MYKLEKIRTRLCSFCGHLKLTGLITNHKWSRYRAQRVVSQEVLLTCKFVTKTCVLSSWSRSILAFEVRQKVTKSNFSCFQMGHQLNQATWEVPWRGCSLLRNVRPSFMILTAWGLAGRQTSLTWKSQSKLSKNWADGSQILYSTTYVKLLTEHSILHIFDKILSHYNYRGCDCSTRHVVRWGWIFKRNLPCLHQNETICNHQKDQPTIPLQFLQCVRVFPKQVKLRQRPCKNSQCSSWGTKSQKQTLLDFKWKTWTHAGRPLVNSCTKSTFLLLARLEFDYWIRVAEDLGKRFNCFMIIMWPIS